MKINKNFIIYVCISVILNVTFFEIFLRFLISSPCRQVVDKNLGYLNIPNSHYVESMEGFSRTTFNSLGFNDNEPMASENSDRKIFVVGDSYTEGFQVNKNKNYAQILENILNADKNSKKIDIIKICRDGFIPIHYPEIIKRYYDKFHPEMIIVQFGSHSVHDLYSNEVKIDYDENGKIREFVPKVRTEDKQKERFRVFINNSSLLYYLIKKYKGLIMTFIKPEKLSIDNVPTQNKNNQNFEDMILRMEFLTNKLLDYRSKLFFIYLPEPGSYMNNHDQRNDISYNVVKYIAHKKNIPLIVFEDEFISFYNKTLIPSHGFSNTIPGEGHLNIYGHNIVGNKIANQINDRF